MSKAEPTEGEWKASGLGVYVNESGTIGRADIAGSIPYTEACANARLFAASKDLLRELDFAYAYLEKEDGGPEWKAGIERMRAAIAKAKGEA